MKAPPSLKIIAKSKDDKRILTLKRERKYSDESSEPHQRKQIKDND